MLSSKRDKRPNYPLPPTAAPPELVVDHDLTQLAPLDQFVAAGILFTADPITSNRKVTSIDAFRASALEVVYDPDPEKLTGRGLYIGVAR